MCSSLSFRESVLVKCHSRRAELLHEDLEGCHAWVLSGLLGSVEVVQLCHGADIDVISKVTEHSGRDAPLCARDALLVEEGLATVEGLFGALRVYDLVEARQDVTTSDVLERGARLNQQAALRNFNSFLLPVASPHVQAGVARLTVDGHEADVVVEASEDGAHVVLYEVTACRA